MATQLPHCCLLLLHHHPLSLGSFFIVTVLILSKPFFSSFDHPGLSVIQLLLWQQPLLVLIADGPFLLLVVSSCGQLSSWQLFRPLLIQLAFGLLVGRGLQLLGLLGLLLHHRCPRLGSRGE